VLAAPLEPLERDQDRRKLERQVAQAFWKLAIFNISATAQVHSN
jgi:hypothetical protein